MSKSIAGQTMITSFKDLIPTDSNGNGEKGPIKEIKLDSLVPFKNHPFHVVDDEKMQELVESIQQEGVLNPILVRKSGENKYEIVSGHRRKLACEIAGVKTIPAIVKELNDAEAINIMVDSNIQRENILPSEKAYAYKLKYEAEKQQGKRTDLTSGHDVQKLGGKNERTDEDEISGRQIRRYIRLTYLNKELLDMVDSRKISMDAAIELSYIGLEEQKRIFGFLGKEGRIGHRKAKQLRKLYEDERLDGIEIGSILINEKKENNEKVVFLISELTGYFPEIKDPNLIKASIIKMLKESVI